MLLCVWVASHLSLLINKAAVKVFLHRTFSGPRALSFSRQPMWISSFSHATLSLCHLIYISNMTSQSRISIDVFQWAALGIRVQWCCTVWDFPIFCRKFGIPVSSMRYQSCPSVTMTTQSPPAAWEARVCWPLHIAHWFVLTYQTLIRVP